MTLALRLRPTARADLREIWTYTKQRWSAAQAKRYVTAIHAEIERLREKPDLGRPVRNAQHPFFKHASGSHVIFYLIGAGVLDVVRVLHERMDFTARLADNDS